MNHTKSISSHSRLPGILAATFLLAAAFTQSTARAQVVTPSTQTSPTDENAEVVVLPEFAVSTSAVTDDLRAEDTLGAMRISTPLVESPITVSVLTAEFLEAFMLQQEHDQVAFIAGGSGISEWQGGATSVMLRGFATGYFRNGFRRWGYNATVNVERVEYIKGPLAATFGRSEPGGLVNYITKRAQRKPAYNFSYNTGSYDYQDVQLSATGPVAKNLFYRVDFQYTDRAGVQDFFYQRTYTASTSFTWQISPRTSWMFDFEHKLQTLNRGAGAPVMRWMAGYLTLPNGKVNTVAVSGGRYTRFDTFNARGPDDWIKRKTSTIDTRFEHRFSPHLSLRINGQFYNGSYEHLGWGTASSATSIPAYRMESGQIQGRVPHYEHHAPLPNWAGQADLLATFKIGATSHKLLLTMDGGTSLENIPSWTMSNSDLAALPATVRNLDPENPDWSGLDRSLLTEKWRDERNYQQNVGFLLSERMELLRGRMLLYASLRNDNFYARFDNYFDPAQSGSLRRNVFNHTYGGVMHIVPGKLIVFANRSTSFAASTTVDRATGKLQDPITGQGVEAGARGEIIKAADARRALYWSASLYRIDRRVPQRNPFYADEDDEIVIGIPYYLNSGIERVDGVELELFGNVSKEFSISLAYTKLDAYIKSYADEPAREGLRKLYVPAESISATARYRVSEGPMRGFSAGFSMRYTAEYFSRYGSFGSQVVGTDAVSEKLRLDYGPINNIPNNIPNYIETVNPPVTLFDVFAEYEFRTTKKYRHTIGINIKNLNDTVWYTNGGMRNPGRQVHLRYRLRF